MRILPTQGCVRIDLFFYLASILFKYFKNKIMVPIIILLEFPIEAFQTILGYSNKNPLVQFTFSPQFTYRNPIYHTPYSKIIEVDREISFKTPLDQILSNKFSLFIPHLINDQGSPDQVKSSDQSIFRPIGLRYFDFEASLQIQSGRLEK